MINLWSTRLQVSEFLVDMPTLFLGFCLAYKIIRGNSGTHCDGNLNHDVQLISSLFNSSADKLAPPALGFTAYEGSFRGNKDPNFDKFRGTCRETLTKVVS